MDKSDTPGESTAADASSTEAVPYKSTVDRRVFLSRLGKISASAGAFVGVSTLPAALGLSELQAAEIGPLDGHDRQTAAFLLRTKVALEEAKRPLAPHPTNGDEALYPNKIANYSKGLEHKPNGEVVLASYRSLIRALESGAPADFEEIRIGGVRKLVNPQSGLAYDLEGADSHHLTMPRAPAFASAEEAGEMVELYWMALLRDVPATEYDTNPLALAAVAELNTLSDFRGPRIGGQVTPQTLFRESVPGALVGPYFSQFWWLPTPFGADYIERRALVGLPGVDFMTAYVEWLSIQNGNLPSQPDVYDPVRRLIRNGRDIAGWVHFDVLFQAYFEACLIMGTAAQNTAAPTNSGPFGLGVPFNVGNPYNDSETQEGFGTFGLPAVKALMSEVATRALKAVWYQKWFVHRRLRPEEFGGRIQRVLADCASYPIDDEVLDSEAVELVFEQYGTYLLPQAFPEGCPLHPSFGAGHATVAGACVTILKAMFDGSFVIPNPVVVTPDGLSTVPYVGPPLTVTGELNKHASNVAIGRNHAGIHWRSDATDSLTLGEAVAISVLRDQRPTYNEDFRGFTFQKFDGTTITV